MCNIPDLSIMFFFYFQFSSEEQEKIFSRTVTCLNNSTNLIHYEKIFIPIRSILTRVQHKTKFHTFPSQLIIITITHNHPSPTIPSWCESNQFPTKQLFSEKNAEIKRNLATLVTDPIHNPLNASLHLGESSK